MKKIISLIIVVLALVAVNLAWIALLTNTPLSLALAQPKFTPAAPEGDVQSIVHQEDLSPSVAVASAQSPTIGNRLRSLTADELTAQQTAQVLSQSGLRFRVDRGCQLSARPCRGIENRAGRDARQPMVPETPTLVGPALRGGGGHAVRRYGTGSALTPRSTRRAGTDSDTNVTGDELTELKKALKDLED